MALTQSFLHIFVTEDIPRTLSQDPPARCRRNVFSDEGMENRFFEGHVCRGVAAHVFLGRWMARRCPSRRRRKRTNFLKVLFPLGYARCNRSEVQHTGPAVRVASARACGGHRSHLAHCGNWPTRPSAPQFRLKARCRVPCTPCRPSSVQPV